MAKGKPDPNWKKKVLEWKESGQSAAVWSKANNIPYTTFLGWKERFEKSVKKYRPSNLKQQPTEFIELEDKAPSSSGVILEYQDIKIQLEPDFNPTVLKQCLSCLRGGLC